MASVGATGSLAQKLDQIEMVTELIASGSISAPDDAAAESSGGSSSGTAVGNLLNTKS